MWIDLVSIISGSVGALCNLRVMAFNIQICLGSKTILNVGPWLPKPCTPAKKWEAQAARDMFLSPSELCHPSEEKLMLARKDSGDLLHFHIISWVLLTLLAVYFVFAWPEVCTGEGANAGANTIDGSNARENNAGEDEPRQNSTITLTIASDDTEDKSSEGSEMDEQMVDSTGTGDLMHTEWENVRLGENEEGGDI